MEGVSQVRWHDALKAVSRLEHIHVNKTHTFGQRRLWRSRVTCFNLAGNGSPDKTGFTPIPSANGCRGGAALRALIWLGIAVTLSTDCVILYYWFAGSRRCRSAAEVGRF